MLDAIQNFAQQFSYSPEIVNGNKLKAAESFIVAGMGGSQLAAGLLKDYAPKLNVLQHRNYDLPEIPKALEKKTLVIISSYSGNTEEILDSFRRARKKKLPVAVLTAGGTLLTLAHKHKVPYIELPDKKIEPRSAIGYSFQALLALTKQTKILKDASQLVNILKPSHSQFTGQALAQKLKHLTPVIYASEANQSLAYFWKITLNETAKIPAFFNVLPELNHNEMTSYESHPDTHALIKPFAFLLLHDSDDHPRIQKRMTILENLFRERHLPIHPLLLEGTRRLQRMFNAIILAEWTAYYTSQFYRTNPDQVPMIEDFKKRMEL